MIKNIYFLLLILTLLSCKTKNNDNRFIISTQKTNIIITRIDGSSISLKPEFILIYSKKKPKKRKRYVDHGYIKASHENEGIRYHVPVWGKPEDLKIDPNLHVMDGFNPEIDRQLGKGQTANMFLAGETKKLVAEKVIEENGVYKWIFPENNDIVLEASISLDKKDEFPSLKYKFTTKKEGYFSLGYIGSPEYNKEEVDEIWQAMIWNEKRFPNGPYITESYHSQLPTTFIKKENTVYGLIGAPEYLPFMPMPNAKNSQFGVAVRNIDGLAQSTIYSPVLGGINSKMKKGDSHQFKTFTYIKKGNINDAYKEGAVKVYNFGDIRKNTTVSLNTTFENMVNYSMSTYAEYNKGLRGSNYSTDVPGAVKNISGLHPLTIAVVTDNTEIYKKRALPMLQFGFTRNRFLFSTNDKIKRDGTTSILGGPGVPMSDLSTTYTFSGNKMSHFLETSKEIYDNDTQRILNLDVKLDGNRWQNAMYLYRATNDEKYLEEAKTKAAIYLKERVNKKQTLPNDKYSRGMFFWTSYTNQFMELYLMYLTTGEQKYLDAAHQGARDYTKFCWVSPKIPNEKVLVNKDGFVPRYGFRSSDKYPTMKMPEEMVNAWELSEHGLTPESAPTSKGHRGIFMTQHAPFMMRIAAETGDTFLRDMARNAVIGRYENFPGYHMNSGRTNAYSKYDFPLNTITNLNGHTSMHYNHPWSHAAMLLDYLMADAYYSSDKKINMNPEYAEGYAYCRSLIYGANEGNFYEDENVIPYMPEKLVVINDVQVNYIAARGNDKIYFAFTNQSDKKVNTTFTFDTEKAGISKEKTYITEIWIENKKIDNVEVKDGKINLEIAAKGITAIAINKVTPKINFQENFYGTSTTWKKDYIKSNFYNGKASIFNMGKDLVDAYFMITANNDVFKQVALKYKFDNNAWKTISKEGYPYEYSISVPENVNTISYQFVGKNKIGNTQKSNIDKLIKK
ncbi:MAG: hypothetical protein P8L21_03875 [Polaribacter sp.]|nr:hypothetical protein [Polaribacter sp.]